MISSVTIPMLTDAWLEFITIKNNSIVNIFVHTHLNIYMKIFVVWIPSNLMAKSTCIFFQNFGRHHLIALQKSCDRLFSHSYCRNVFWILKCVLVSQNWLLSTFHYNISGNGDFRILLERFSYLWLVYIVRKCLQNTVSNFSHALYRTLN